MKKLTLQINFRVDPETRQRLLALCLTTHRSQSSLLRYLIHQLWVKHFQAVIQHNKH
jgi:predicted DNA-binding protein